MQKWALTGIEVLQFEHNLNKLKPQEIQNFAFSELISSQLGHVLALFSTKNDLFSESREFV